MTTKPQSTTEPELKPCRCGRRALLERFQDGNDPQPLFVATCEVCPVKTYDQFTAEEAARVWNEFVSATVNIPEGHWQHVQIKAGNPRVVAIQFETAEQATAFINSFAAAPASATPVVELLAKAKRVIDAACALQCAGCAATLPLDGRTHKPTAKQVAVGYVEADCTAFGAVEVAQAIAAATAAPPQTSSEAWRRWFERLGTDASAEIVNATADLVTNERLAALVDAKVLPSAAPVEQSESQ